MSVRVLEGCALAMLPTLAAGSVQTCVTSPPYFNLRDYGVAGQIGLESSPDEYVAKLVEVFRAVRRVLRDDGTAWLNISDSYARAQETNVPQTKNPNVSFPDVAKRGSSDGAVGRGDRPGSRIGARGLKPKDLIGIPWMLAFALRADGWYLRSEIIWAKPNPMPESVQDRPTKAHEQVFLLAKSERYFYDAAAVAEEATDTAGSMRMSSRRASGMGVIPSGNERDPSLGVRPTTRNARSVWSIATQPFSGAHFATMPPELARRAILAGTSPRACEHCGAPWARVVEVESTTTQSDRLAAQQRERSIAGVADHFGKDRGHSGKHQPPAKRTDLGFAPTCSCPNSLGTSRCTVLDPFGGAGTTALVADRLNRDAILVELNPEYAAMARDRIRNDNPLFTSVA